MDVCVRNLVHFTRCSKAEAIEAASLRPAELLGEHVRRGTLDVGSRADLLLLTSALIIQQTWVAGQLACFRAADGGMRLFGDEPAGAMTDTS